LGAKWKKYVLKMLILSKFMDSLSKKKTNPNLNSRIISLFPAIYVILNFAATVEPLNSNN